MSIKEHSFPLGSKAIGAIATLRGVMHCLRIENGEELVLLSVGKGSQFMQENTKTSNEVMHS